MQVIISARQVELADGYRELVEQRLQRLERFESRVARAEVTLLEEKNHWQVEGLLRVDRGGPLYASAQAPDFRTALDRMSDKLERQLRRHHSRRRDHQGPTKDVLLGPEES